MNEQTKNDINKLKLPNYRNSTPIIGGMTTEDVVTACLAARLNLFVIGETGEGKTQIENDIMAMVGNNGFYEQGRDTLTLAEIFTKLNLQKLRSGDSTEGIKEATAHTGRMVYVIDELNRCLPEVANQFFNLFDGYITIDGRRYELGHNGYSIGIATGNIGNGDFQGTHDIDRALLNRMHVILNINQAFPGSTDTLDVLAAKSEPRVAMSAGEDCTETILRLHDQFKQLKPTQMQYCALLYLVQALDYVKDLPGESKRKNQEGWPGNITGHEKGSDAALVFPFSTRAALATKSLAKAFEMVREAKGNPYTKSIDPVLDAAYLIGAHSGILSTGAVNAHYHGSSYDAMNAVIAGIRAEWTAKEDVLKQAISAAQKGELRHKDEFTGRWKYMQDVLSRTAEQRKQ